MTPQEKLTEVFNKYAGKVIFMQEMEGLLEQEIKTRLSPKEMPLFLAANAGQLSLDDAAKKELVRKTGDGSLGLYGDTKGLYANTYILELSMDFQQIAPSIAERVSDAFAKAFERAADHSADVKSGKLRPVPPKDLCF